MLSNIVRRYAVEKLSDMPLEVQAEAWENLQFEFPSWGIILMGITLIACILLAASFEYTANLLLVNLAIIESPTSATVAIYKPVSEDPDAPLEKKDESDIYDVEVETATISGRPITHSIKKSIMHLQSVGGFKARWRGIRIYSFYSCVTGIVQLFVSALPIPMAPFFGTMAAAVIGARIHCAWTHATITMPSEKKMCQRMVPRQMMKYLVGPNILKTLAAEASAVLVILTVCLSVNRSRDILDASSGEKDVAVAVAPLLFWVCLPILVAVSAFFVIMVPANIILIRCEASLLAEDEETIVPMDRTFGGRLMRIGEILTPRDALKSFTAEAWSRLIKLYVKYFFVCVGLLCFTLEMLALESWIIMGDNLFVLIAAGQAQLELMSGGIF